MFLNGRRKTRNNPAGQNLKGLFPDPPFVPCFSTTAPKDGTVGFERNHDLRPPAAWNKVIKSLRVFYAG